MSKPLLRIPYTGPLPPPLIFPLAATTADGAIHALARFLTSDAPPRHDLRMPAPHVAPPPAAAANQTVLLTGAGISVASGLADYRGEKGTYTQNKSYRPIYFHEFVAGHEARKRYWARSFLGWRGLNRSGPNASHFAVRDLGRMGLVSGVVTQNVDSFHNLAHPGLATVELHGYLRRLVCLSCRKLMDRDTFQHQLATLNPAWAAFLHQLIESGALDTENPEERRRRGLRTNPDGDADVPGAPYTTFRYPACPNCVKRPPILADGSKGHVEIDGDGACVPPAAPVAPGHAGVGVLKPNVIMFGESIPHSVKAAAEAAIDAASKVLVIGSSLATYSAWRLVKRAHERGMGIGVLNLGGVRKEEVFFGHLAHPGTLAAPSAAEGDGHTRQELSTDHFVRASFPAEQVLPGVVDLVRCQAPGK